MIQLFKSQHVSPYNERRYKLYFQQIVRANPTAEATWSVEKSWRIDWASDCRKMWRSVDNERVQVARKTKTIVRWFYRLQNGSQLCRDGTNCATDAFRWSSITIGNAQVTGFVIYREDRANDTPKKDTQRWCKRTARMSHKFRWKLSAIEVFVTPYQIACRACADYLHAATIFDNICKWNVSIRKHSYINGIITTFVRRRKIMLHVYQTNIGVNDVFIQILVKWWMLLLFYTEPIRLILALQIGF